MSIRTLWDDELLARLDDALDGAQRDPDEHIRALGGAPREIGLQGMFLASTLLEKRRLAWQTHARARLDAMRARASRAPRTSHLSRGELLARLDAARNDARLGAPVVIAFRDRADEAFSDDELRALLDQIEMLRRIAYGAGEQ